jgi:hypothetical protein
LSVATCSTNEPIVQKRRGVEDGGERDIPPARTQCFSKSTRDFVLSAVRNPCVAAIMADVSWDRRAASERGLDDQLISVMKI